MTRAQAIKKLGANLRRFKRKVGASSALVLSTATGENILVIGSSVPPKVRAHFTRPPEGSDLRTLYLPFFPRTVIAVLNDSVLLALVLRSQRGEPRTWLGFRHRKQLLSRLADIISPSAPGPPPDRHAAVAFGFTQRHHISPVISAVRSTNNQGGPA